MNLKNIKIGTRLGLGYGLVLVLLASIVMLSMYGMNRSNSALHHIVEVNVKKMDVLADMSSSIHIVARVVRSIALLDDEAKGNVEFQKIVAAREKYSAAIDTLEKMPLDDAGKNFIAKLREQAAAAEPLNNQFLELIKTNKAEAPKFLLEVAGPANTVWQDSIHDFIDLERAKNRKDEETADAAFEESRIFMSVLSVLAICMGSVAAWLITKSITVQINSAVQIAKTVASGDLTSRIDDSSNDEIGELLSALKDMNFSLVNIVGQVQRGAEVISGASKQIASGNKDLSFRTEEQASSLEETVSSMEQLTSTVKQNSDNARQANLLAVSASDIAVKGSSVVAQVVDTMGSINDSSKKIVDIIGVIDGIAFQTNILALNAAVEAARAGEQGRGFAVVASEVRNLAQRSAAAAKEIKTLIGNSVDQVDAGAKLVDQAGTTMQDIVDSIKRVTDIMSEISTANVEQSSGIEQITQVITNMDDATQQNAVLVEQAAAAAEALEGQVVNLNDVVGVFKLDTGYKAAARSPVEPVRNVPARKPAELTRSAAESKPANPVPNIKAKPAPAKPVVAKVSSSQFGSGKPAPATTKHTPANEEDWEEF